MLERRVLPEEAFRRDHDECFLLLHSVAVPIQTKGLDLHLLHRLVVHRYGRKPVPL